MSHVAYVTQHAVHVNPTRFACISLPSDGGLLQRGFGKNFFPGGGSFLEIVVFLHSLLLLFWSRLIMAICGKNQQGIYPLHVDFNPRSIGDTIVV